MKKIHLYGCLMLLVVSLIAAIVIYPTFPDQVPIHWDIDGNVDGYGDKAWAVFLMPGIIAVLIGLFLIFPRIDPKRFEVLRFQKTYGFIALLITALMTYIHGFMLWGASHENVNASSWLVAGIFLFLAALGTVLRKTRRNFWIGIRTPWTLADERVWNETHRFGGRLFIVAGILGFISVMIDLPLWVGIIWIAIAAFGAVAFSLIRYKQLEHSGELSQGPDGSHSE